MRGGLAWLATGALLAGVALAPARADVRLPRLISDNMVLQRAVPLSIWGWAAPGERVRVRFRHSTRTTRAGPDGRWSVELRAASAGGPDVLTVRGRNSLTIRNVLVGEVWLASGQSNMEYPVVRQGGFGGVAFAERELASANLPRVRLLTVRHATALRPEEDIATDGWMAATPESVGPFSAVGFLYARALHESLGVPVGIVLSAWGGTPAECWVSAPGLGGLAEFADAIARAARLDPGAAAAYERYLIDRNAWYRVHGTEDRGRVAGVDVFAAPDLDTTGWIERIEPGRWPIKDQKDFDGTVWFRRTVTIHAADVGAATRVHLGAMLQSDTTYFNGVPIGATDRESIERNYPVPAAAVRAGENLIAIRLTGAYASGEGYVGMLGDPDDLYLDSGGQRTSLAGPWRFAAGADLGDLPPPPALAEFRTPFPQAPTLLYNGMIAPLIPFRIKGVIWYQGESNVGRAAGYRTLFPALIDDWRRAWHEQLPFLYVQLAGFGSNALAPNASPWAELREAQAAALSRPRTGMATAVDIGNPLDVHPANKQEVARRLALAAERIAYGQAAVDRGPTYAGLLIDGKRIRVRFDGAADGVHVPGGGPEARGFAIAGTDGHFEPARASIDGHDVIVRSDSVDAPVAVRYDWANTPDGNLYGETGLPVLPFRSDSPR